jgi:hypothetical protein
MWKDGKPPDGRADATSEARDVAAAIEHMRDEGQAAGGLGRRASSGFPHQATIVVKNGGAHAKDGKLPDGRAVAPPRII